MSGLKERSDSGILTNYPIYIPVKERELSKHKKIEKILKSIGIIDVLVFEIS